MPQTVIGQGESIDFEFLLFGSSAEYVPSLIGALEEIRRLGLGARRNPFRLLKIINSQTNRIIWRNGKSMAADVEMAAVPYCEL